MTFSVVGNLLLVSVLAAVHLDVPCYLTPNELGILFGPPSTPFQLEYAKLLDEGSDTRQLSMSGSDCLLYLLAILADSICLEVVIKCLLGHFVEVCLAVCLGTGHIRLLERAACHPRLTGKLDVSSKTNRTWCLPRVVEKHGHMFLAFADLVCETDGFALATW